MDALERRAREAVDGLGDRGRTQRSPDDVRVIVMRHAEYERARGRRWAEIARAVGLSPSLLVRCSHGLPGRSGRLARVAVSEAPVIAQTSLVLVCPGGCSVEGLDVAGALDLLRALS
jgi:hypothetical protein